MEKAYVDIGYSEVFMSFFVILVETYSNYTFASWISNMKAIKILDNQTNFRSRELVEYLKSKGIEAQYSIPFEHFTNGKAEQKSRQTPCTKNKIKYTPLQRFFNNKERELSNTITSNKQKNITLLFVHGYYKPRPDINSNWLPCYVLQKVNNYVYIIMEPRKALTRRTSRFVKLTTNPLPEDIIAKAKTKLEGCNT
uniref:Integrase catalytic domain-containing protein n=1 Tax=Strongyloides stercoralis TaxID=6248 RepID=A0AAF5DPD4_STRER